MKRFVERFTGRTALYRSWECATQWQRKHSVIGQVFRLNTKEVSHARPRVRAVVVHGLCSACQASDEHCLFASDGDVTLSAQCLQFREMQVLNIFQGQWRHRQARADDTSRALDVASRDGEHECA